MKPAFVLLIGILGSSTLAQAETMTCTGKSEHHDITVTVSDSTAAREEEAPVMSDFHVVLKALAPADPSIDVKFQNPPLVYGRGIGGMLDRANETYIKIIFDGSRAVAMYATPHAQADEGVLACSDQ